MTKDIQNSEKLRPLKSKSSDSLIKLLAETGSMVEVKSNRVRSIGVAEDRLYACLSDKEQLQLTSLLNKLNFYWKEQHKAHHQNRIAHEKDHD